MKAYEFSKSRRRGEAARNQRENHHSTGQDILNWFRDQVENAGGGNYQTMINEVLRKHVEGSSPALEDTLRRIVRGELKTARK